MRIVGVKFSSCHAEYTFSSLAEATHFNRITAVRDHYFEVKSWNNVLVKFVAVFAPELVIYLKGLFPANLARKIVHISRKALIGYVNPSDLAVELAEKGLALSQHICTRLRLLDHLSN